MTFIVEDGSGILNANSYCTVQEFKDYWDARGVDVSSISDDDIEELLVKATTYIDSRWGHKFCGTPKYYTRLWSRSVLSVTGAISNGETITIGSVTYTFTTSTTPADDEAEIEDMILDTLVNMQTALGATANDDWVGSLIPDPDNPSLVIYTLNDGVVTTETMANGSFDNTTSTGDSRRRQPLEFPRSDLYDRYNLLIEGVPDGLKYATIEYAYRANSSALDPDPTFDETGLGVKRTRKKLGSLEKEVEYQDGAAIRINKPWPAADRLIMPFTSRTSGVIR